MDELLINSLLDLLIRFRQAVAETNQRLLQGIAASDKIDNIKLFVKNRHIISEIRAFENHIEYNINKNIEINVIELCDERQARVTKSLIDTVTGNHLLNSTCEVENMQKLWKIENTNYLTGIYKFVTVWYVTKPAEFPIPTTLYHGSNR